MTIRELNQELVEAYRVDNLNKISLTLINLFKTKQYSALQKIADIISDFVNIRIMNDGRGFSRFMMLYHPDRASFHINEINKLTEQNNFNGLLDYSHIFRLERIEEIASYSINSEDLDYAPVYEWDFETEGFSIIYDNQAVGTIKIKTRTGLAGYTFYDAIKLREFGSTDIEYPPYYLENIDEFELSSSGIKDLDGVEYCIHAISIDVSNNRISDLSPLFGLTSLEELNLSDNQIGYIDALSNLIGLKNLFLSGNQIEDISPLFGLEKLEFVDLSGNKVNSEQVDKLKEMGISVVNEI